MYNAVAMERDLNIGSWIRDRAAESPQKLALADAQTGERWSYAVLNKTANRCAASLQHAGLRAGDRIAVALQSEPIYLALYFAAAKLGAIFLPLNSRLTASELGFQLADAEAKLVLTDPDIPVGPTPGTHALGIEEFRAALPDFAPEPKLAAGGDAPQVIMYTSGTTGVPKGAVLPHRKTRANSENAVAYFGLGPDDCVVVPVPLFHSYGLKILSVPALFAGASVVLVRQFDPVGLQRTVRDFAGSVLGAVPVMYRRMLQAGVDRAALASLRFGFSAGAPLDPETVRAFAGEQLALRQGFGQTETSILCAMDHNEDALAKLGSVGRPVGNCELRITDETGRTQPAGITGEILVRGPIVMLGYWKRPQETLESRQDGWHRTGDLARMDSRGFVTLVGRRKELYISGGENVYPAEVENVLLEHPNVADCAVVGVADPEWGEVGCAYIVPRALPLETAQLLDWTRERLARFKCPRQFVTVQELPRTASGKVQKHLLGR